MQNSSLYVCTFGRVYINTAVPSDMIGTSFQNLQLHIVHPFHRKAENSDVGALPIN